MKYMTPFQRKLIRLMRIYGYRYDPLHMHLTRVGIPGFTSDAVLPYVFRDAGRAVEYLIPILEDSFYKDLERIGW